MKKVASTVKLGKDVFLSDYINLYGCSIGDNTKVGPFVEIQKNAYIGANCKIQSHTFICEGVSIDDNVFIGHGVMFTNDIYPRSTKQNGEMQNEEDWEVVQTLVKKGASIGSNATLLCGIEIGLNSIIGAGSVVTKNIPDNVIVAGNPAKIIRKL